MQKGILVTGSESKFGSPGQGSINNNDAFNKDVLQLIP